MSTTDRKAVVVDDDEDWRDIHVEHLKREGFNVASFVREKEALQSIRETRPQIVLVHFTENIQKSVQLIQRLAKEDPTLSLLYPTYYGGSRLHRRAMKAGAFDVVDKLNFGQEGYGDLLEKGYARTVRMRAEPPASSTTVFVLMPFAKRFNERYRLGIKEPLEDLGLRCERVDEIQFTGNIVQKVYASIESAALIVADMTGKNPNVFYEVGYAHAIRKPVVLLTEKADDIPFDLKGERHIVYGRSIIRLRDGLVKTAREVLKL